MYHFKEVLVRHFWASTCTAYTQFGSAFAGGHLFSVLLAPRRNRSLWALMAWD
jgi:hypothetical protein